jgi:hypothetical protein
MVRRVDLLGEGRWVAISVSVSQHATRRSAFHVLSWPILNSAPVNEIAQSSAEKCEICFHFSASKYLQRVEIGRMSAIRRPSFPEIFIKTTVVAVGSQLGNTLCLFVFGLGALEMPTNTGRESSGL